LHVLSALQAIHDANLVHRDVKPANIQVCGGDRVVLTDFGLSSPPRVMGGLRSGVVTGSLPYLAPETILDGRFGPPSDLYALGVTLYKAVEGHAPFDTSTPSSVLESVLSDAPMAAEHAGALDVVLDGLLEKDPRRRMDVARTRSAMQAVAISSTDIRSAVAWEATRTHEGVGHARRLVRRARTRCPRSQLPQGRQLPERP
jgi:serine/threonine protein kinase